MIQRFVEFHHSDCPPASVTPRCWFDHGYGASASGCLLSNHQNTTTPDCLLQKTAFGIERRCCSLVKDAFVIRNIRTQTPVLAVVSPVFLCIVQQMATGQSACQSAKVPTCGVGRPSLLPRRRKSPERGFWMMQLRNAGTLVEQGCVNKMRVVVVAGLLTWLPPPPLISPHQQPLPFTVGRHQPG